ncbi:MAG: glycerol-3-phosphate acyltransferase [Acidimicrobiia bacterium]|nr:glycerol-3-phosphate acyltransferase [Acidimicrobiia bacterium]
MLELSVIVIAFLIGGLPTKRTVSKLWGVDLATIGTGNAGAGNAARSVGLKAGVLVAVLDGLKGLVPVLVGRSAGLSTPVLVMVGLTAVAGNNWPFHMGHRGGRGLATSVGVVVGLDTLLIWWPALWSSIGWGVGGGIAGFFGWGVLPIVTLAVGAPPATVTLTVGLAVMMMVRRAQGNDGLVPGTLRSRVLFDDDVHTLERSWGISRPSALAISGTLVLAYGAVTWWVLQRSDLPAFGLAAAGLLLAGIACEFGAKWAFGELFREGLAAEGRPLRRGAAFRAALVGAGVARLIPAGGAITPVAMAWSVRDEAPGSAGAALRATVLNYGGLLMGAGGGLIWVTVRFAETRARTETAIAATVMLLVGIGFLAGAARLSRLTRFVPLRWRERFRAGLSDSAISASTVALIALRVALEAAALGLTLRAFGIVLSPSRTLAVFGASQLIGGLPGTPGGLGYAEGGLAGSLAFFDVTSAFAPILVFRMISLWLPALAGLSAGGYSFLKIRAGASQES